MTLVDIGANRTHFSFREDLDAVLTRSREAGVYPHHARECDEETIPALRALASHPRVVAIGECGLDFNRNYSPHPDQEKWFEAQLELACEIGKPRFLHSRDAHPRFGN